MTKAFATFYEFATTQGFLNTVPEAVSRLKDLTETFHRFGNRSSDDDDFSSQSASPERAGGAIFDDVGQQASTSSSSALELSPKALGPAVATSRNASDSSLETLHSVSQEPPLNFDSLPYEVIAQPTPDNASYPFYNNLQPQLQQEQFSNMSGPTFFQSLAPPVSYSDHEGSFTRRLHRTTSEAGLRLVSMNSPPPDQYAAVFGFCLLFESRDKIMKRLETSLRATREEGLNYWRAPFTNLGGSGTFFSDATADGMSMGSELNSANMGMGDNQYRELFRPQEITGFSMGPFDTQTQSVADNWLDERMRMLMPGFRGNFYDASEVEKYLAARGIDIPPYATFVDADINFNEFLDPAEDSAIPGPSGQANPNHGMGIPNMFGDWGSGDMTPGSGAAFSYCPLLTDPRWPRGSSPTRRKVRIDIEVLLDGEQNSYEFMCTTLTLLELIGKAVCLGRTPGFRPKHVNKALKVAIGAISRTRPCDRHKD